jgi:hypothetical protein
MDAPINERPLFEQFDILDDKDTVKATGLRVGANGAVVAWIVNAAGRKLDLKPYVSPEAALEGHEDYRIEWREIETEAEAEPVPKAALVKPTEAAAAAAAEPKKKP